MQLISILGFAAATVAPSMAAPTPQPNYWWNVTDWSAGCGRLACHYDFEVKAPPHDTFPGFKAECTGRDKGYFKLCDITGGSAASGNATVAAKLKHQEDPKHPNGVALMSLSFQFTDDGGTTFNYTGRHTALYNNGVPPGQNYRVYPTKATAIDATR